MFVEILKSKISHPEMRDKLSPLHIANFFTHFLSGNEYLTNLEVKDFSSAKILEVMDKLKVKGKMNIEELNLKSGMTSKLLNVTDRNEIIFEDDAPIRLKNSPINFKARDIFEVVAFMKFIIKICGRRMEKCDFENLLKNRHNTDKNKLMSFIKHKFMNVTTEIVNNVTNIIVNENCIKNNSTNVDKNGINNEINVNVKKMLRKEKDDNNITPHNFKFKEQITTQSELSKTQMEEQNSLNKIRKEIEAEIDFEFKKYKEHMMDEINDYEIFANGPMLNSFNERYYNGN